MDVGIEVTGLKEALAGIDQFLLRADDQTPVWTEVGKLLERETDRRFTRAGEPAFWPERKNPVPWPALHKTGELQRSISETPGKLGVKQRATARYGWYLQRGSRKRTSITSSAALRAVGEGAATARAKGRDLVLIDGKWHVVSKRGVYSVEVAGFGGRKATKAKFLRREQAGRGGIAPRPFLFLGQQDQEKVRKAIEEYLLSALLLADEPVAQL